MSLFATFLRSHHAQLLECLQERLYRSLPEADRLSSGEVLGNASALLHAFAAAFERGASAEALLWERLPEAEEHGRRRRQQGFSPDAVALEWGLVRDCLLREVEDAGLQPSLAEVRLFAAAASAAGAVSTHYVVEADRAELQSSAEQLRLLVEGVRDYALIMLDPEGRVLSWNWGAQRIYGYQSAEVVGRSFAMLFAAREVVAGMPRRALELAHSKGRFECEGERVRWDGRTFWSHAILTALYDAQGGLRGYAKVTHDTSEQHHAQQMQSFFVRAARELAGSLDLDVTLRALAELTVEQLAELCILDLLGDDGRLHRPQVAARTPRLAALLERLRAFPPDLSSDSPAAKVLREGKSLLLSRVTEADLDRIACSAEHRALLGELRPTSNIFAPLMAHGRVLGVISIARAGATRPFTLQDMEVMEGVASQAAMFIYNAQLYRDAREAVRTREDVLAVVSHDLKSPLGVVALSAAQLQRVAGTDELGRRTARHAATISRAAARMNRLIRDLLDFASLGAGTFAVHPVSEEADTLLAEACEVMEPIASVKGVHLAMERGGNGARVLADRERVLQVLSNLVGNSVKFSPAGGTVTLRTRAQDGEALVFEVEDHGAGIAPQLLPRIFERFVQARETAGLGTGLGLAIAHGIVERHGGRIWAHCPEGGGTVLSFTLPRAPGL